MFKKILLLLCFLTFFKTSLHAIAFHVNNLSNYTISANIRERQEPIDYVLAEDENADVTGTVIAGPALIGPGGNDVFEVDPGNYTLEVQGTEGAAAGVTLGEHITVAASGIGNTFEVEEDLFADYESEEDNENEEEPESEEDIDLDEED